MTLATAFAIAALAGASAVDPAGVPWPGDGTVLGIAPTLALEADIRLAPTDDEPDGLGSAQSAATSEPRVIYLWYATGAPPPSIGDPPPCKATPPAYTCSFGSSVEDCQRKVQALLDRWYAGFNVVFTLARPTSGVYYTVLIASDGAWCSQGPAIGGYAPFRRDCSDMAGGTAYAFLCGTDAKTCAIVIAQEQAHLVGLQHTSSSSDVMYPMLCPTCDGFEDRDVAVVTAPGTTCGGTQNSYRLMVDRLGAWPGGAKPGPWAGGGGTGGGGSGGGGGVDGGGGSGGGGGTGGGSDAAGGNGGSTGAPDAGHGSTPVSGGCTLAPAGRDTRRGDASPVGMLLVLVAGLHFRTRRSTR